MNIYKMNYKNKYLKYKNKYTELKNFRNNQIGGNPFEELLSKIINPETNEFYKHGKVQKFIKEYYYEYLYNKKICESIEYIQTHRKNGKKIMLIVGSVPEQSDKFNILPDYVPFYCEDDIEFLYYTGDTTTLKHISWLNILTKSFEEYPLLFAYMFNSEKFYNMFDLIVFDTGTVYWMELDKNKLLNLFRYTYDNSSIVVLDNQTNMRIASKNPDTDAIILSSDKLPMYFSYTNYFTIMKNLNLWFQSNFSISETPKFKLINHAIQDVDISEKLSEQLNTKYYDDKLHIFYYRKNIFYNYNYANKFYIYFTNTKVVLD